MIRPNISQIWIKLRPENGEVMLNKSFLKRLYPLLIVLAVFIVWKIRKHEPASKLVEFTGRTPGKIGYTIKYYDAEGRNFSQPVDSMLAEWNNAFSIFIPSSEVSTLNRDSCHVYKSPYFLTVLKISREVYERSHGAFDPTVGPLVNAWGFGPEDTMMPDSAKVDSLKALVGFNKVYFNDTMICKADRRMQLNFNALADGDGADIVTAFLESKGIKDILVDVGGELKAKGEKPGGQMWRTAIEDPTVDFYEERILAVVNLKNKGVATSGNYRNYYVKDGRKYVHTIDPESGYPALRSILSASVFSDTCAVADAFATSFMVMGVDRAKEVLAQNKHIDAYLVYTDENGKLATYVTDGIAGYIEKSNAEN